MRKLSFLILVCVLACGDVWAQFSPGIFNSPNQQLVEQAVRRGVVLLSRDYQLLDTVSGVRYGWNNQPLFNSIYSVGVRIGKGCVVTDWFACPWQRDSRYAEYRNGSYRPMVVATHWRTLADSVTHTLNREELPCAEICEDALYWVDSLTGGEEGFRLAQVDGKQEGWLVWVTTKDEEVTAQSSFSIVTYKYALDVRAREAEYALPKPVTTEQVLGGFYVVAVNPQIGMLDFQVVGVAFEREGAWHLATEGFERSVEPQRETTPLLTPVVPPEEEVEENGAAGKDEGTTDRESKKKNKRRKS